MVTLRSCSQFFVILGCFVYLNVLYLKALGTRSAEASAVSLQDIYANVYNYKTSLHAVACIVCMNIATSFGQYLKSCTTCTTCTTWCLFHLRRFAGLPCNLCNVIREGDDMLILIKLLVRFILATRSDQ